MLPNNLLQNYGYAERTVLPIICYTYETSLTNFSEDKTTFPVHMTLHNILSEIRNKYLKITSVLLALLSVKTKISCNSTVAHQKHLTFHVNQLQKVVK